MPHNAPNSSVTALVALLERDADDAMLIDALELAARDIIEADLLHRLVPWAARLRSLDTHGHPFAGLVAGVPVCAIDRPAGRAMLDRAQREFETAGDDRGNGYASFLNGLQDLGEGNLETAEAHWSRAESLLGKDSPVSSFSAMHRSLSAYGDGALDRAASLAEQALHAARRSGDARQLAIAGVYLSLFRWWMGDFDAATGAGTAAHAALETIPDPLDRYESPIALAAPAAVAYLRGDHDSAAATFETLIGLAASMANEWYDAIVHTIRAQVAARRDPSGSIEDARHALAYYERIDERWWSRWALETYVAAQREAGDLYASLAAAEELLALVENPLERGRALLEHGATLLAAGRADAAAVSLRESTTLLDHAGARYLCARAELLLARADPTRGAFLVRSARSRARHNGNDPAWRALLRGADVRIQVLGSPGVWVEGRLVQCASRQDLEALCFLALRDNAAVSTDELIEALWPGTDPQRSAHRLDVLVSSTRRALQPATRLLREHGTIRLDVAVGECDVTTALRSIHRAVVTGADSHEARAAREALRQPLLAGSVVEWVVDAQHLVDARTARYDERFSSTPTRSD